MMKAKIESSRQQDHSVVVCWNDGLNLYFDPTDLLKSPVVVGIGSKPTPSELVRRIVVSRTSAESTLNGCAA